MLRIEGEYFVLIVGTIHYRYQELTGQNALAVGGYTDMDYLEPISPCCLDLLCVKIGSKKLVCNFCNKEFVLMESKEQ